MESATQPGDQTALCKPCDSRLQRASGLATRLLQIAAIQPEATVVTTTNAEVSYASMAAAVESIAAQLELQFCDGHGDRVILLLPNSVEYIAAFYGVLLAGGVVVPVAPKTESETLRRIAAATNAVHIITTADVLAGRNDLQDLPIHVLRSPIDDANHRPTRGIPGMCDSDQLAAIFYTGGTSGMPKGVMLSHSNLISNAMSIGQYLKITKADNPLCVLPFMHAFGNSVLQSHLLAGARLTLCGHAAFPQTIVDGIIAHQCSSLSGVPDFFRLLLSRTSLGQLPLPDLRYMAVAGGALPQHLVLEMAERIKPAQFFVMYGQTEATARLAYVPPERLFDRPDGAIGRAIPGVTLEVVNEKGTLADTGTVGELRARGPNVMLGYWKDSEETNARIRGGWLYTGDLATCDEQGWLVLRGRDNSFLKIAGFRVHPQELEEFAVRRLGANQAVAVPINAKLGTRLALFLKFDMEQAPAIPVLMATCRTELPHHLAPETIQLVDEFPFNHAMKIDRPALSKIAEQSLSQRLVPV